MKIKNVKLTIVPTKSSTYFLPILDSIINFKFLHLLKNSYVVNSIEEYFDVHIRCECFVGQIDSQTFPRNWIINCFKLPDVSQGYEKLHCRSLFVYNAST